MAQLSKSVASLRIFGDTLDPDKITRILGCSPTDAHVKGQIRYKTTVYRTGGWILESTDQEPANLDAQVAELLGRVNNGLEVWSAVSRDYTIDLFCGFFMDVTNEDVGISAETMKLLSERGIRLCASIYAPTSDIVPSDPCPCNSGKTYEECCAQKNQG
jgi:uncharacterized protein YchJ